MDYTLDYLLIPVCFNFLSFSKMSNVSIDDIKKQGKIVRSLLKDYPDWSIKVQSESKNAKFVDSGTVMGFKGVFFVHGNDKYFNPPEEILKMLERPHDNIGLFYVHKRTSRLKVAQGSGSPTRKATSPVRRTSPKRKSLSPKRKRSVAPQETRARSKSRSRSPVKRKSTKKAVTYTEDDHPEKKPNPQPKVVIQKRAVEDAEAPMTNAELMKWSSRDISRYLLGDVDNYNELFQCIISQLKNVDTETSKNIISQLSSLLEGENQESDNEVEKFTHRVLANDKQQQAYPGEEDDEDEDDTKRYSELKKRIKQYEDALEKNRSRNDPALQRKIDKLADVIKRTARSLGMNSDVLENEYEFYGFGSTRHMSNERPLNRQIKRLSKHKLQPTHTVRINKRSRIKKPHRRGSRLLQFGPFAVATGRMLGARRMSGTGKSTNKNNVINKKVQDATQRAARGAVQTFFMNRGRPQ